MHSVILRNMQMSSSPSCLEVKQCDTRDRCLYIIRLHQLILYTHILKKSCLHTLQNPSQNKVAIEKKTRNVIKWSVLVACWLEIQCACWSRGIYLSNEKTSGRGKNPSNEIKIQNPKLPEKNGFNTIFNMIFECKDFVQLLIVIIGKSSKSTKDNMNTKAIYVIVNEFYLISIYCNVTGPAMNCPYFTIYLLHCIYVHQFTFCSYNFLD